VASAPSTAPRSTETAPQTPASASSQPAVDVTALTTRDDFLLELGETLDGQAAVRPRGARSFGSRARGEKSARACPARVSYAPGVPAT
jgi:hypothetical protein